MLDPTRGCVDKFFVHACFIVLSAESCMTRDVLKWMTKGLIEWVELGDHSPEYFFSRLVFGNMCC